MQKIYKIAVGFFDETIRKFRRCETDLRRESIEEARDFVMAMCRMTHEALRSEYAGTDVFCNANVQGASFIMGLQRDGRQYPIVVYEIKPVKIVSADEAIDMVRRLGDEMR